MEFDYPKLVGELSDEERLRFYEALAHNLTVGVRAIWSDEELSDARKVEALKWVNEIMHRVVMQTALLRLRREPMSDAEMWETIRHWSSFSPAARDHVGWAIKFSYDCRRAAAAVEETSDGAD